MIDLRARLSRSHKEEKVENNLPDEAVTETVTELPSYQDSVSIEEKRWKPLLYQKLLKAMDLSLIGSLDEADARRQIGEILQRMMAEESVPLNMLARQRVVQRIEDEILGLGPLEPLLDNHTISDILVNGHDTIYVERFGKLERTDIRFDSNEHLLNIIDRIVKRLGGT